MHFLHAQISDSSHVHVCMWNRAECTIALKFHSLYHSFPAVIWLLHPSTCPQRHFRVLCHCIVVDCTHMHSHEREPTSCVSLPVHVPQGSTRKLSDVPPRGGRTWRHDANQSRNCCMGESALRTRFVHIYMYVCVCLCVCVFCSLPLQNRKLPICCACWDAMRSFCSPCGSCALLYFSSPLSPTVPTMRMSID